ncbi:hypothetical protein [Parasphaerochaeta coccoides]|uniref:Uncharacterized protein n=1 Tax=Parasphaerochaeta coccoides (strain ATCC BAA-1237 / DSM 17374 / SPN1) TaxID=760011 RepID=F4GKC0_PARC1|nr:hypothetical protein [Parasphaerochaeta coccoides]AEC02316.1 hypothetical protein Spico_1095 [Parasphaerochaeta coccoides DSM 17374]
MDTRPAKRPGNQARRTPGRSSVRTSQDVIALLAKEFSISANDVMKTFRGCGISPEQDVQEALLPLYREIFSCRLGRFTVYASTDKAKAELLDSQLRGFDEIFVDTAPIIHEDLFLRFVADAYPMLRRRKKRLVILEKTMEELHGLKDNPAKDREVRIRALVRPELIRHLARMGVVRIQDTGSTGIADDHLVSLFSAKRAHESLLLITQDRGLSERIVQLAEMPLDEKDQSPVQKLSFFARLIGRTADASLERKMEVCKFDGEGALLRCYVCPDCGESYYDTPDEGSGMVICQVCYEKRKTTGQIETNTAPVPGSMDVRTPAPISAPSSTAAAPVLPMLAASSPAVTMNPKDKEVVMDEPAAKHKHVDATAVRIRTISDVLKSRRRHRFRIVAVVAGIAAMGVLGMILIL